MKQKSLKGTIQISRNHLEWVDGVRQMLMLYPELVHFTNEVCIQVRGLKKWSKIWLHNTWMVPNSFHTRNARSFRVRFSKFFRWVARWGVSRVQQFLFHKIDSQKIFSPKLMLKNDCSATYGQTRSKIVGLAFNLEMFKGINKTKDQL